MAVVVTSGAAMNLADKLNKKPPYKLLALDGGGIRGLITIEVLAEIERVLQQRLGRGDDFVLADYFDYVAGTSTGGVIATCIALGLRLDEIRSFYFDSAELMFEKASILKRLNYKFEDEPIAQKLRTVFKEKTGEEVTRLGSSSLRTLLMIVLRNASTDSPWPLSNNPQAKYNCPQDRPGCNLSLPLWQVVRASTAAPTYFPPEQISVGTNRFVFVDGGITTFNNPAFQLFLMATVEPYNLSWRPRRPEDMLLVSIGTGTSPEANGALDPDRMNLLFNASTVPSALMFAALNEQDVLCRVFGRCLVGDRLDRELDSMVEPSGKHGYRGPVDPKLFTYLRYNAELTRPGLAGLGIVDVEPEHVQKLDSVKYKAQLVRVGQAVAQAKVKASHFAGFDR
jgi:hypothetical protein